MEKLICQRCGEEGHDASFHAACVACGSKEHGSCAPTPEEQKQALVVILRSDTGRGNWELCPPAEVPEWVKKPDVMANLVRERRSAMKCDEGDKGSAWYIARDPEEAVAILNAQRKRIRKALARAAGGAAH